MNIITENDIDESVIEDYFAAEKDLVLLPGIPEKLNVKTAAMVLSVSEPTIVRMVEDHQIELNRTSILDYIRHNYLVFRPLKLTQNTPN